MLVFQRQIEVIFNQQPDHASIAVEGCVLHSSTAKSVRGVDVRLTSQPKIQLRRSALIGGPDEVCLVVVDDWTPESGKFQG